MINGEETLERSPAAAPWVCLCVCAPMKMRVGTRGSSVSRRPNDANPLKRRRCFGFFFRLISSRRCLRTLAETLGKHGRLCSTCYEPASLFCAPSLVMTDNLFFFPRPFMFNLPQMLYVRHLKNKTDLNQTLTVLYGTLLITKGSFSLFPKLYSAF